MKYRLQSRCHCKVTIIIFWVKIKICAILLKVYSFIRYFTTFRFSVENAYIYYIYIYIHANFFLQCITRMSLAALIFPKEIIYPHQIVQKNDLFVPRHGLSALEKYIISLIVSWLYFHFVVYQYRWHDTVSLISFPAFLPTTEEHSSQHFASF